MSFQTSPHVSHRQYAWLVGTFSAVTIDSPPHEGHLVGAVESGGRESIGGLPQVVTVASSSITRCRAALKSRRWSFDERPRRGRNSGKQTVKRSEAA
jgi:hypothetical protein